MRPARSGFTLIEVLAALAIAGLLAVALAQSLAAVNRSSALVAAAPRTTSWQPRIRAALERDLDSAVHLSIERDGRRQLLRLETLTGRKIGGDGVDHGPALVRWLAVSAGQRLLLCRETTDLLSPSNAGRELSLMAVDIRGFSASISQQQRSQENGEAESYRQLAVIIQLDDNSEPLTVTKELSQ